MKLPREPTLGAFLPGPNAEALAAVSAQALGNGEPLLYLEGPDGRGKSHLLQGACIAAGDHRRRAHYCPLGRQGLDPRVLDGLEGLDLVALDDLERISGDARWESAIFDLFNRLRERHRALLVAAATPPDTLGVDLSDLRSRLQWGVRYRLRALSDDDCAALVAETARQHGLRLGPEMVRFILTRHERDPDSLLSLLERLDSLSLREQHRITLPLIKRAMAGED